MRVSNNNSKEIDSGQVSRSRRNERASKSESSQSSGASSGAGDAASVNISGEAKALSQAQKVAKSEEVDQAKIDKIKAAINEGTYKPDYGKVADRLINEQVMQELA